MLEGRNVMRDKRPFVMIGMILALVGGAAPPTLAQELFVVSAASGLEFYQVECFRPAALTGVRSTADPSSAAQGGQPIYTEIETFEDLFPLPGSLQGLGPALVYRGFRTSPSGRVLMIDGRFLSKGAPRSTSLLLTSDFDPRREP